MALDDFLQRGVDVLGHAAGIATDIDTGTLLQPAPQLRAGFEHALLHVDLFGLVTGESGVQAAQVTAAQPGFQFLAVVEVAGGALLTEEQPVPALGTLGLAFLQEGAKRRDAGTGADHDHRCSRILRDPEVRAALDKQAGADTGGTVGEKGRTDPATDLLAMPVAYRGNRQVHLRRGDFRTGGNRIKPWLQRLEQADQLI